MVRVLVWPARRAISSTGPGGAGGLVIGKGAVWVASYLTRSLAKIRPDTNSVAGTLKLPPGSGPNGIAWADGYFWVTESGTNEVAVIRPS